MIPLWISLSIAQWYPLLLNSGLSWCKKLTRALCEYNCPRVILPGTFSYHCTILTLSTGYRQKHNLLPLFSLYGYFLFVNKHRQYSIFLPLISKNQFDKHHLKSIIFLVQSRSIWSVIMYVEASFYIENQYCNSFRGIELVKEFMTLRNRKT